jgi:uncharacterized protein
VATRPAAGLPRLSRRSRILLIIGVLLLILLVTGSRLLDTYVDWLWFGEVGFRSVFSTMLVTRIVLFFATGLLVGGTLCLTLVLAYRTRPVFVPVTGADDPLSRYRAAISRRLKLFGIGLPVIVGLIAGAAGQGDWQVVQLFLHGTSFGVTDPQFGNDIGFYAFTLPFILWLKNWLFIAVTIAFFGALFAQYIFGGIRLAGRGGQLSSSARVQLGVLIGAFVLLKAFAYFTDRYELLYSDRYSSFTGASYTDLNALLPAKLILLCIAVFCALAFFAGSFLRNLQLPGIALILLVISSVLIGAAWPAVMQQFSVSANANQRESTPIARAMTATRQAYDIGSDKVSYQAYDPSTAAPTLTDLQQNTGTVPNLRMLDPNVLAPTFNQQQHGRNIFGFPSKLNIDRYTVDGTTQDYVVAAREIDPDNFNASQQTWFNEHFVYTHGDGFVAAPANQVTSGGYPQYIVSDLDNGGNGPIKVSQPRIYYGLLPDASDYAVVGQPSNGQAQEYDTDTKRYTYTGSGGVSLSSFANRLAFAMYYGERNFLFSGYIGDQSKIIFNRNPRDRVQEIAPWLTADGDPYPAVVDDSDGKNRIAWIVDCYTTLQNYPYAKHTDLSSVTDDSLTGTAKQPDSQIGYIRNSVKAVVDAYSGKVTLYSVDDSDPVLKAWEGVFPGVVQPSSAIPPKLADHFRYPEDLFKVQRQLLSSYHVTNPQDFYSSKGFWSVPADPTKNADGSTSSSPNGAASNSAPNQPPYYVLAQAPGQSKPTFQLTSDLTALQSQNLAAWVSVSSDPGSYGKFTVLTLPTGTQTQGPEQMQNQFDTTSKFTENRTLFNNNAVKALFGNLLTLPVAGGLLYVEPIYIQSTSASGYPQLNNVLTGFNGRVGLGNDVDSSLADLFASGGTGSTGPPVGNSPPSSSSAPPTTTTTAPPAQGGGDSAMAQAVARMNTALSNLQNAQKSGNFAQIGQAYQDLQNAINAYQAAESSAPGSGSSAPPTPTPGSK